LLLLHFLLRRRKPPRLAGRLRVQL
jgi:hypothetical protein